MQCDLEQITNFPYGCGMPKDKWKNFKLSANFIMACTHRIMYHFGINVIFAGNEDTATKMIERIMKDVAKNKV